MLYVYAIARQPVAPRVESIDGTESFEVISAAGVNAVGTRVDPDEFSQEAIDRRSGDVDWLGAIGYRHQHVIAELMKSTDVVPLRAFSLFSSEDAVRQYLDLEGEALARTLERFAGKREWTLRVEFDPDRWTKALANRDADLKKIEDEIAAATPGKAYLLRKKLEDARRNASRRAEAAAVSEIQDAVVQALACDTIAESREQRGGAFPQINVLLPRDEEVRLEALQQELNAKHDGEGISVALTGPWPPYTFASGAGHG